MPETMFVRLRPYDRLKGQLKITYKAPWGTRYKCGEWHEMELVADADAQAVDFLRNVRQHENDQHSLLAFDVCTEAEAKAIREAEMRGELEKLERSQEERPTAPTAITATKPSKDLNRPEPLHELDVPAPKATAAEEAAPVRRRAPAKRAKKKAAKATERRRPSRG
jgi:hypothetical protein